MRLRSSRVMPAASSSAKHGHRHAGIFVVADIGDGLAAADKTVVGVEFDQQVELLVDLLSSRSSSAVSPRARASRQRATRGLIWAIIFCSSCAQAALGGDIQIVGEGGGDFGDLVGDGGCARPARHARSAIPPAAFR